MGEYLGELFHTGDAAPASGAYQLMNDDPNVDKRTNMGRVFRFRKGETLPPHPDTNGTAEWRFMRIKPSERDPEPMIQPGDGG